MKKCQVDEKEFIFITITIVKGCLKLPDRQEEILQKTGIEGIYFTLEKEFVFKYFINRCLGISSETKTLLKKG